MQIPVQVPGAEKGKWREQARETVWEKKVRLRLSSGFGRSYFVRAKTRLPRQRRWSKLPMLRQEFPLSTLPLIWSSTPAPSFCFLCLKLTQTTGSNLVGAPTRVTFVSLPGFPASFSSFYHISLSNAKWGPRQSSSHSRRDVHSSAFFSSPSSAPCAGSQTNRRQSIAP